MTVRVWLADPYHTIGGEVMKQGDLVRMHGLLACPWLDGAWATLHSEAERNGCWEVQLQLSAEKRVVNTTNLQSIHMAMCEDGIPEVSGRKKRDVDGNTRLVAT